MIVDTLLCIVPPFLIGSMVTLSEGSRAVVVTNHHEAPCRSTVRLVSHDRAGKVMARSDKKLLDLRMCPDLCIAEVDGVDVQPYLFDRRRAPAA